MRKKFPVQGMFLGSCLLAGTLTLCSCGSESDEGFPEQTVQSEQASQIVKSATVRLSFGGGLSTRLAGSGSTSSPYVWEAGDRIVAASNGHLCGTLVCSAVDSEGGTFSGTLTDFDAKSVRLYFLGNQNVEGTTVTFDFSQQTGSESSLDANTFFYLESPVQLQEEGSGNWTANVPAMLQLTKQVELKFWDKDSATGIYNLATKKVSKVLLYGLKNHASYNLLTGTVEWDYAQNLYGGTIESVTLEPSSYEYDNDYTLVLPSQVAGVTMLVTYLDSASGTSFTDSYTGLNWDLSDSSYSAYSLVSLTQSPVPVTSKGGYSGQDIMGGTNNSPYSTKPGYSGNRVDGQTDDEVEHPQSSKPGYGGNVVQE